MGENDDYILVMKNITKRFPGVVANDNITLSIRRKEIHAICGENGAGKSTLMSILFGLYEPDEGEILIDNRKVRLKSPNDANRYRIGMVHQHFRLVHNFSALENIVLGAEPLKMGLLDIGKAKEKINDLMQTYGLTVDLDRQIDDMTVGMQQRVEILKMLYRDNDILIFDEPTAVLTPQEIDELLNNIKKLKNDGKTIIFISHKLAEVKSVSDRCTILSHGKVIATVNTADTSTEELSEMMIGHKVQLAPKKSDIVPGDTILDVKNLTVERSDGRTVAVKNASFNVRKGEIVCIAGVDGNGQTELASAITGLMPVKDGQIILNKENIEKRSIRYRNTHGISYVPEDRHKYGLVLDFNLEDNLVMCRYFSPEFQQHGIINRGAVRENAEKLIVKYDIRTGRGPLTTVRDVSGGNQQKIILAREIESDPDLMVAVQPTRGLDVGSIETVHNYLLGLRDAGKAVLLISLELDEVLAISDRILVMYNGEIVCNMDAKNATPQELGLYMMGLKKEVAE